MNKQTNSLIMKEKEEKKYDQFGRQLEPQKKELEPLHPVPVPVSTGPKKPGLFSVLARNYSFLTAGNSVQKCAGDLIQQYNLIPEERVPNLTKKTYQLIPIEEILLVKVYKKDIDAIRGTLKFI